MLKRILTDSLLRVILPDIDRDLAEQMRARGCSRCGATLHSACYPRKPRCMGALGADWSTRLSFCCAREGCRRRHTPPSVRFLRRRLFPTIVIILATTLTQGITARRRRTLEAALGVDRRTLSRWRQWWRDVFAESAFWKEVRARFIPSPDVSELPGSLLSRFGTLDRRRIVDLLRFLEPISI